jgi:P4 family phage/plasmid primase-like protien
MDTRQYCLDYGKLSASFNLSHDGKKKVYEGVSWSKITTSNLKSYHNNKKNGFMILTGSKNNIIVLDCDIGKAEGKFPQDLLDYLNSCCKSIVETPNGKHYYFSTDKIIKKQIGGYWKGNKIDTFDILAEKASVIAPPSHYTKGDTVVSYKWIVGGLDTLEELSEELFTFISKPEVKSTSVSIETILDNLSVERFTDYTSWLNIGMILKSEGYSWETWDEYSKKASNYQSGVCYSKFLTFDDKSSLTVATLYKYLKEDNIEAFYSLKKSGSLLLESILNSTHANYAELFYINYNDDYIYDKEKQFWYVLQPNNTWKTQKTVNLKIPIKTYFTTLISKSLETLDDSEDSIVKKKQLKKAENSINTNTFVESVISWLKEYFTPTFNPFDVFDTNRNIFAFNNCIYDNSILSFRDILPTDYITITTGYDLPSLDIPVEPKLEKFLNGIFENEEQKKYLLRILAYSLFGDRRHQELYMFSGAGGNGKGIVINLLISSLGNYCKNLPSTYVTKPSDNKDGALPTLAEAKDARILYTSEIEAKEYLQIGFLKQIVGGDVLTVRKLNSSPFSFTPQFNLFILCNDSKLSKVDLAIKRRLRVIKFPFQFREQEDIRQDNDRLIDKSLESYIKTEKCILSFITLLLRIYIEEVYNKDTLNQSETSKLTTREYLAENNPVSSWLFENYDTNSQEKLSAGELLKQYNNDNQKIRPNEFSTYLSAIGYDGKKYQNKVYYNFKKKENNYLENEE